MIEKTAAIMGKTISLLLAFVLCSTVLCAQATPNGAVVYALPRTTISLKVEAEKEFFTPGPYAQYAEKYLGSPARTSAGTSCRISRITVIPYVEADPVERYAVNIPDKSVSSAGFLKLCSQGLIVMSDSFTGKETTVRFPSEAGAEVFAGKDPSGAMGTATTTLFKAVKTAQGFERVAVQQSQVVEKSLEKRSQDAAESIFNLRTRRVEIITGDTDATFSGEALQAAVNEINRLEAEYLSLFYGFTETITEEALFDIIPQTGDNQTYTAFRISDSDGLQPASVSKGKPVTVSLEIENLSSPATNNVKAKEGNLIYYRVPAIATCKVSDDTRLLIESRIPVYQFGEKLTYPIDLLTTK